ncbi:MAG: helix-turn-helix domain-containing protein [Gemmataceae bacterium]
MKRHKNTNRPTMSVPEAGKKYFGLSKNAAYAAARRGQIPTIPIGGRLFVPVVAMERMIESGKAGPT